MHNLINSIGLVLDISGAILLWRYGLPEALNREGKVYMVLEREDDAEKALAKSYDRWAKVGLGSLIAGFAFQLVSNYV
jgi:hypothetical protein